ncbi:MAG: cysteine--tRNA ligase [Defluviitaleaceae bacterium]|nr:cysteine--tRNA ligase [Defluviitaleaceae bacterium]
MKIYNTLTRKKEDFVPIQPKHAGIYICGPTVYNFIHIGNARPYVVFDVLRRYLTHQGYTVNYVQNFTDIDDRIIAQANEQDVDFLQISNRYITEFFTDTDGLNIARATHYPRVTEEIPGIIALVQHLITRGYAYEVAGTVYFCAPKADNYGKLSKKNIEDLEAGARVEINADKQNPSDFVLWKAAKEGEPSWPSPWGDGRPGWHIECSVMARKYIGKTVDIHAGGVDLIFPHHENEIAQSEAEMEGPFVNYWMHNGMLLLDNKKMSKSEGNFFLVREVAEKYSYEVARFYLLSGHYRMPLNFSEELIQAAANGVERIRNCKTNLTDALQNPQGTQTLDATPFRADFLAALADDLNTANAITALFDLVKFANINISTASAQSLQALLDEMHFMAEILGLNLSATENKGDTAEIEALIEQRNASKAAKNWAAADEIRDALANMGVIIKDTREGTKWHYAQN